MNFFLHINKYKLKFVRSSYFKVFIIRIILDWCVRSIQKPQNFVLCLIEEFLQQLRWVAASLKESLRPNARLSSPWISSSTVPSATTRNLAKSKWTEAGTQHGYSAVSA